MKYILLILLLIPTLAHSDLLAKIGVVESIYEGQFGDDVGYQAKLGWDDVYVWGSTETTGQRILGQPIGSLELLGYGFGAKYQKKDFSFLIELGYFEPTKKGIKKPIQNEVLFQTLRNDFGEPPFNPTESSYNLKRSLGGRIGISYEIVKHLEISAAYRVLKLREELDIWTGTRHNIKAGEPDCVCWWQERNQLNLNSIELGLFYKF